jgi:hypothetical protein
MEEEANMRKVKLINPAWVKARWYESILCTLDDPEVFASYFRYKFIEEFGEAPEYEDKYIYDEARDLYKIMKSNAQLMHKNIEKEVKIHIKVAKIGKYN